MEQKSTTSKIFNKKKKNLTFVVSFFFYSKYSRAVGIEPTPPTSEIGVLPLHYALCSLQSKILVNQSENARISRDPLFNYYFLLFCLARSIAFCAAFFACGLFLQQELHVISAQRVTISSIEVFLSFSTDQKPISSKRSMKVFPTHLIARSSSLSSFVNTMLIFGKIIKIICVE